MNSSASPLNYVSSSLSFSSNFVTQASRSTLFTATITPPAPVPSGSEWSLSAIIIRNDTSLSSNSRALNAFAKATSASHGIHGSGVSVASSDPSAVTISSSMAAATSSSTTVTATSQSLPTTGITLPDGSTIVNVESLENVKYWSEIVLIMCFCLFIIITVIGNTLVILSVITTRRLRTVTNCFVMSLAVADWLVGVFVMPPAVAVYAMGKYL